MTQTALFYCGILDDKTLPRCIESIQKYVLPNANIKIFAVLSSNEREKHENFIRTNLGSNISSIDWVDHSSVEFQMVKSSILPILKACVKNNDLNYFENSDVLLEYFRLYIANQKMVEFEYKNNIRFDFICRIRPDAVLCSHLMYPSENIKENHVKERLDMIQEKYKNPYEVLSIFMNSLFVPDRIHGSEVKGEFFTHSLVKMEEMIDMTSTEAIIDYIQNGKYIVSIGKNMMFITRRHHYTLLSVLGLTYGNYYLPSFKQWLDPPEQFQICCLMDRYAIFDSITKAEIQIIKNFDESLVNSDNGFMFIVS